MPRGSSLGGKISGFAKRLAKRGFTPEQVKTALMELRGREARLPKLTAAFKKRLTYFLVAGPGKAVVILSPNGTLRVHRLDAYIAAISLQKERMASKKLGALASLVPAGT